MAALTFPAFRFRHPPLEIEGPSAHNPLYSPSFGEIKVTGRGNNNVQQESEQGHKWDVCGLEPDNRIDTD